MTRTLADMAPAERDLCVGMWCELGVPDYLVVLASVDDPYDGHAAVMVPHRPKNKMTYTLMHTLTPRPDLPRAWTPSGEPVPGEWEEKIYQDGIGDYVRFTRQRRYITDWEVPHDPL